MKRTVEVEHMGCIALVEVELLSEMGLPDEYRAKVLSIHGDYGDCRNSFSSDEMELIKEKAIDEFKMSI